MASMPLCTEIMNQEVSFASQWQLHIERFFHLTRFGYGSTLNPAKSCFLKESLVLDGFHHCTRHDCSLYEDSELDVLS